MDPCAGTCPVGTAVGKETSSGGKDVRIERGAVRAESPNHAEAPRGSLFRRFVLPSGADRDRTGDPLVANQVLSQLSYRPEGRGR